MSHQAKLTEGKEPSPPSLSQGQIFIRFLRFGLLAWGGPVAQIAMIRRELVDEEHWVSSGRFNRLLASIRCCLAQTLAAGVPILAFSNVKHLVD